MLRFLGAFTLLLLFVASAGGQSVDCNENGLLDTAELRTDGVDCNGNGIPDECEGASIGLTRSESELPLDSFPRAFVVRDLNGDGRVDLATGNREFDGTSSISVVFTREGGEFEPATDFPAGDRLEGLVALDFDVDGDLDLATAGASVLTLANSGGVFEPHETLPVDGRTLAVAAGDIRGDSSLDLVVVQSRQGEVLALEGRGDGSFAPPRSVEVGGRALFVTLGDLEGDGDEDLIVALRNPTRIAYRRRDGAELGEPTVLDPGETALATSLRTGDLDLDGDLDLILGTEKAVFVFGQESQGTFSPAWTRFVAGGGLTGAIPADMDQDGDLDLVLAKSNRNSLLVFLNDGAGEFPGLISNDLWFAPRAVSVGDFDADGDADVVLGGVSHRGIAVVWNRDDFTPSPLGFASSELDLSDEPHGAAIADFNDDGVLDLATSNGSSGRVTVRKSVAGEPLAGLEVFSVADGGHLLAITAADLDGDRDLDLVIADSRENDVKLLVNDGAGSYSSGPPALAAGGGPRDVAAGDFTEDGAIDLLCANRGDNTVTLWIGDGGGGFQAMSPLSVGRGPVALKVSDLDADGYPDVIVANSVSREITILWGDGGGEFSAQGLLFVRGQPSYVVVSDLNGDDAPDIATSNDAPQGVTVFLKLGGREFASGVEYPTGESSYSLITTDLDADGVLDLVTANDRTDSVSILRGSGDGTFRLPLRLDVGREPRFVLASDFNQNGRTDLITTNKSSNSLSLLLNSAGSAVDPPESLGRVCTEAGFRSISAPFEDRVSGRVAHFVVPVSIEATLQTPVFVNANLFEPVRGLPVALPDVFLDAVAVERLVTRRAAREYVAGSIVRLASAGYQTRAGPTYAFTVHVDDDPAEALDVDEVAQVYAELTSGFLLRPLAYLPAGAAARDRLGVLRDAPFPIVSGDPTAVFRRGDVDADGRHTLGDALLVLAVLFDGKRELTCQKSADLDDDARLNLLDPLALLGLLFGRRESLPTPFHVCGADPTPDPLGCASFPDCR